MGKEVMLRYWHPVVTRSPFQVKVEGYLLDEKTLRTEKSRPYRSSPIVEAIQPRELLSKNGTIYSLDGPVDLRQCRASGMSQDLIDQFETGFPSNFASLLRPRVNLAQYLDTSRESDAGTTERRAFIDDFEDDESDKSFDPMRERRKMRDDFDEWSDDEEKQTKPKPEKKPKKWTKAELEKLGIALLAVAPRDPEQWQNIAKSFHGTRTAEECKAAATEQLKWRKKEEGDGDEDKEDAPCVAQFTAKKGSAKFKIQTDQFTRNFLLGGSEDDRFDILPSSGPQLGLDMSVGDGDSSYLEAVRTPGPGSVKRPNKRKLNQQAVFTLDESSDESKEEEDETESQEDPENVQRYVHQIVQKGKFAKYRPKKQKKLTSAVLARINAMAIGNPSGSVDVEEEEEDEEAQE